MIRSIWVLVFFHIATVKLLHAQDTKEPDSVVVKWHESVDWTNLGLNAQIGRHYSPTPGGMQEGAWLSSGLFVKRWQAGVFISTYEETYQQMLIFPNQFDLNYLYSGCYLGYTFLQNRWFQSNLTLSIGRGDVLWERALTFENYFRDTFTMIHYMLEIEGTPIRFIRPLVQFSYRKMSSIQLPEIENKQFSGLSVIAGVRFGLYTKRPEK
ncbi:MAG: hypothetical protein ACO2ZZ_09875 [Cyclobacteriaceae bacterium]